MPILSVALVLLLSTAALPRAVAEVGPIQSSAADAAPQREGNEAVMSLSAQSLPAGSRIYVAPMANGFDTYIVAGFQKKMVPLVVVTSREKAGFEMTGVSETDKAGWAKMLIWGNDSTNETASVKLVNLQSGEVVFAYSVKKANSARGKQSAGESVAKHIKKKIDGI
jgi:hypothetical protein